MLKILYDRRFIKEFKSCPKEIQKKLVYLESIFKKDPFHTNLNTKKLQGKLKHLYSFRITREYRVIFEFTTDQEVVFLAAKHRKDIYKKM